MQKDTIFVGLDVHKKTEDVSLEVGQDSMNKVLIAVGIASSACLLLLHINIVNHINTYKIH